MKKIYVGTIIIFYILLSIPLLQQYIRFVPERQLTENRILESFPRTSLKDFDTFPKRFESYFNDNFGFRPSLVRLNSLIKIFVFHSMYIGNVIVGAGDWLFFNAGIGSTMTIKTDPLTLWDSFSRQSSARFDEIHANGMPYIEIIAPNGNSIYPEFLPKQNVNPQYMEVLQRLLNDMTPYRINLFRVFKETKKSGDAYPLYYRTDTHWNRYGAYLVYREIMKRFAFGKEQIPYIDYPAIGFNQISTKGNGLAKMLELDDYFDDTDVVIQKVRIDAIHNIKKHGTLLIYGDSFFEELYKWSPVQYLKYNFDTVIVRHWYEPLNIEEIAQMKPDAVIFEIAERFIFSD